MATSDYTGLDISLSGVPQRTPTRMRLDVLIRALDNIEKRHYDALDTRNALELGLSQLNLNSADDLYKANLIRDTMAKIDAKAQGGSYADTLTYAKQLAADTMANPELNARVKLNKQYEEAVADVEKMGISDTRKQRWKEENPYNFDKFATKNTYGETIGASDYKPNWTPITNVNTPALVQTAVSMLAEKAGSSDSAKFVNSAGQFTTTESPDNKAVASTSTYSYRRKDYEDIRDNFVSLLRTVPNALESLKQDLDDRRWEIAQSEKKLETLSPDSQEYLDELANLKSLKDSVTTLSGAPLGIIDFALFNNNILLKNAAYNNISNSKSYGGGHSWNSGYGAGEGDYQTYEPEEGNVRLASPVVNSGVKDYDAVNNSTNNAAQRGSNLFD